MSCDLIVIGGGPGGFEAAVHAAKLGKKVVVVDRGEIGGTCLNRGCIPTKTLLHTAHVLEQASEPEILGISGAISCDFARLQARKKAVIEQLRAGMHQQLRAQKIDWVQGTATITASGTVCVACNGQTQTLTAPHILVATGAAPALAPIQGVNLPGVLTSDDVLGDDFALPREMVIIGGGVIGTELAYALHAFGVQVTIIEAMERLLPELDREIAQNLQMIFKKQGVSVYTGASVEEITQEGSALQVCFAQTGGKQTVCAQTVLVATGRRAFTEQLFSEGLAAETVRGALVVDDLFRTSTPGVYAVGDAAHGTVQLAHVASAQGVNAVCAMFGQPPERELSVIPMCVYTDPEIACAGVTAEQAKADGIPVKTGKALMGTNGKSVLTGQKRGFIKLVAEAQSDRLIGAQLMCANATDMIGELVAAIGQGKTASELLHAVRPHPTYNEALMNALQAVCDR